MTQYVAHVLQKPTTSLEVPDLRAIAKDFDLRATLAMCRLLIAIGVQCEKNKEFIDKIRGLGEGDQHLIMKAIEQVSWPKYNNITDLEVCRLWQKLHWHLVPRNQAKQ
jgi:protein HOOK3